MTKKTHIGLPILLLILTSLACTTFSPVASNSSPAGAIVYQSDQSGNDELYIIDVRGSLPTRLTNNTANDIYPIYLRSTNQIGFVSDRENGWNLYAMDLNGNNTITITNNEDTPIADPDWSPDGKLIAVALAPHYSSSSTSYHYDIYVINADGSDQRKLTPKLESEWAPAWSPDGKKIAFSLEESGDVEIYVIDSDGSNLVQLTDNSGYDGRPRWSPDGTKLVFETDREGSDWDIYIMNADGSEPRAVTHNSSSDFSAAWSPDGNWLVYVSNKEADYEIYIVDINGQNQRRLTSNSHNDQAPVWIP